MSLTDKVKMFQYPRDVQSEVWKQWYTARNESDNIIKMNTGSGKTVVALMILQSCLNEGIGPALYVVPDLYLVAQVIAQAKALGIKVTDNERDMDYQRKRAILVVSIQKLVNGKSVFGMRYDNNYEIGSVVIDDIHACMGIIHKQFSITIPKDNVYEDICNLFNDDLNALAEEKYQDIIGGHNKYGNILIPFWGWQAKSKEVYKILSNNYELDYIKFNFDLVKDILKLSHCYVSYSSIEIIPHCVPIHKIASFEEAKRRIYLSATLPDDSPFVTALDVNLDANKGIISPEKANDIGERLILMPKSINKNISEEEVRFKIVSMAQQYNVVVIVPSFSKAQYWRDHGAVMLFNENITEGINSLKEQLKGLTVIVNRYDGIDLPDDACRVLVIDGLPNITNLNDRYEQEIVRRSDRIQREQVQRIEQGMGRGVRSNSDYCLIFLLGNEVADVLYANDGYECLSTATKKQFQLSEQMCEQIENCSLEELFEVGNYILNRNKQWSELCKNVTANLEYPKVANVNDLSIAVRSAFNMAGSGNYQKAVAILNDAVNQISNNKLKGYYKQLMAEYINLYDGQEAQQVLKSAKADNRAVLNPIGGIQFNKAMNKIKEQSRAMVDYVNNYGFDNNQYVYHVESILEKLKFEADSSKRFENAIQEIFTALGFAAYQPESEHGKGPDDFIKLGDDKYLIIECKNETTTEFINKHDCNQLNGSFNWFKNMYENDSARGYPIMIHNSNIFEYACSPESTTRIITPDLLEKLKMQIKAFIVAGSQNGNFKNIEKINDLLLFYKLKADDIIDAYTTTYKCKGN